VAGNLDLASRRRRSALQRSAPCSGLSSKAISPQRQLCVVRSQTCVPLIVQLTLRQSPDGGPLSLKETLGGGIAHGPTSARESLRMRAQGPGHRQASCVPASQRTGCRNRCVLERREGSCGLGRSPSALTMGGGAVFPSTDSRWRSGPRRAPRTDRRHG